MDTRKYSVEAVEPAANSATLRVNKKEFYRSLARNRYFVSFPGKDRSLVPFGEG